MPEEHEPDAGAGPAQREITRLLQQWAAGEERALDQLTPLVYDELHRLASRQMRGERAGHLLQTTALVHEAFIRLQGADTDWRGRLHFFAVAARVMRRVLVDFARAQKSNKRGGFATHLAIDEALLPSPRSAVEMILLDDAIETLSSFDQRKARVVELRFFTGLTIDETAEVLKISHATVERDLKLARAWLIRELTSA